MPVIRHKPITLLLALALAFGALATAPVTAEASTTAAASAVKKASKWQDARRNCQKTAAGKVCLRTQRKGSTHTWRAKLTVKAKNGRWIRPQPRIRSLKRDYYPVEHTICGTRCAKVTGTWRSKWVRLSNGLGLFSADYATKASQWNHISTGRLPRRKKSSKCTSSGRVCVAIYGRQIDDRTRWQGRVSLTPASGRWIAPVKLVVSPKGTKKQVVRTFDNKPRTSRWTARAGDLAGAHVGTVARFTYRTDKGTFTIEDAFEGKG